MASAATPIAPGQVLDLIEEGRVVAAVCLEERKGKVRALTESQREINVPATHVAHVHQARLDLDLSREALARGLRERTARHDALAAEVDVTGMWEVLHEEGGEYGAAELAELAFGESDDDHTAATLRALLSERVHFRQRAAGWRPAQRQAIDQLLKQRAREEEKQRRLGQASQWLRALWEGRSQEPPPEAQEIVELLREQALYGEDARQAARLQEILKHAQLTEDGAPFQLLVHMGIWSPDENLALHRLGTRREFPPAVLDEARKRAAQTTFPSSLAGAREDLVGLPVFTVDSPQTQDIDDALSLEETPEGYRVGVHITDVSALVTPGCPLDQEALTRGTTVYLPDERIPMLPAAVSEGLCSLQEGQIRPAVSLFIDVDPQGTLLAQRFTLSWLRVQRRLSYEEVDAALDASHAPWADLLRIAQAWRAGRMAQGALSLSFPEITVSLAPDGAILIKRQERESLSQVLVSEMMIMANRLAAEHLHRAGAPCIYRGQSAPKERLLEAPVGDLYLNYRQRTLLSRAESALAPLFHHGLGVAVYTMASSPVRRYLDLTAQRQLTALLRGEPPPYSEDDLETILTTIAPSVTQAPQLEQARRRYWLLRHLERHKGGETAALVVGQYGARTQLLLPEYMLETAIAAPALTSLPLGQMIRVRLGRARAMDDVLRVEPL